MKRRVEAATADTVPEPVPEAAEPTAAPLLSLDAAIFKNVKVSLQASLGEVSLSVDELLKLKGGSVISLDRQLNDLVDLRLNDALVGRGEIVAVGDHFGLRIVEIADLG